MCARLSSHTWHVTNPIWAQHVSPCQCLGPGTKEVTARQLGTTGKPLALGFVALLFLSLRLGHGAKCQHDNVEPGTSVWRFGSAAFRSLLGRGQHMANKDLWLNGDTIFVLEQKRNDRQQRVLWYASLICLTVWGLERHGHCLQVRTGMTIQVHQPIVCKSLLIFKSRWRLENVVFGDSGSDLSRKHFPCADPCYSGTKPF